MQVSVCVVTNRPRFAPWLVFNYERQTYTNTELVIVQDLKFARGACMGDVDHVPTSAWRDALLRAPVRACIRLQPVSSEHTLGWLYNEAVRCARGDLVVFWGDDDWHHPQQIETLVSHMTKGAPYAGWRTGAFLDLATSQVRNYTGSIIYPAAAVYRRDALLPFDDEPRPGVDTRWQHAMRRKHGDGLVLRDRMPHSLYLDHGANVSRGLRGNSDPYPLADFVERVSDYGRGQPGNDSHAWDGVALHLAKLRVA